MGQLPAPRFLLPFAALRDSGPSAKVMFPIREVLLLVLGATIVAGDDMVPRLIHPPA